MDMYTRVVLTVIAVALVGINMQLLSPAPAEAGIFDGTPTRGEMISISKIKDPEQRRQAAMAFHNRIPYVYVQGGSIDAD